MADRALILVNPSAGGGGAADTLREAAASRPHIRLVDCDTPEQARPLIAAAVRSGVTVIGAAGGDGTIHAILNALAPHLSAAKLAIIPLGTANDFAAALGLPSDPAAALALIDAGRTRFIDVVKVSDGAGHHLRYLINAATGGATSQLSERVAELKPTWGAWAYFRAALEVATDLPSYDITLTTDAHTLHFRGSAVMIANGRRAGGITLDPRAQPDNAVMDVLAITADTLTERAALLARFAVGAHLNSDGLLYRQATRVTIDADPPLTFSCDGEPVTAHPITFELLPRAIEVFAP